MNAIFFYCTIYIVLITVFGAESMLNDSPIFFGIMVCASIILIAECTLLLTFDKVKKYCGWNLWCKLLKIDNDV